MYDSSQILSTSGLYTRIGVKEPTKTGYTGILDAVSKATLSGFYYDKYHSLANFINIYDCQNDPGISAAEINAEIVNWRKDAIETGLKRVFANQDDLIQNCLQFVNENDFNTTITNSGKFVGFELTVPSKDQIVNVLNNVILQFDGEETFDIYLYHSSQKTALQSKEATTVADSFYKLALDWSLYMQSTDYAGGKFYIGYYQDDLNTVKAYDRQFQNSSIQTTFNGIGLKSFSVTPNGTDLFDIADIEYTSESWGINLDISTFKDYTNLIMTNKKLFDDMQGYAFAIRVLELIKTTGRINPTQRVNENLPDVAAFDLEDQSGENTPKSTGLNTKLKIEIDRVRKSLLKKYKTLTFIPK